MDVLVSEAIHGPAMDALRCECDVVFEPELWRNPAQLRDMIDKARALIVRNQTQVTAEIIAAGPRLEVIGRAGAGLDNVDTDSANRAGIVVTYAPHENSVSVAELTIGLMLAAARKIPAACADTRSGGWNRNTFTGLELSGKTLGIVGLGRIGALVARRANAFDMEIIVHDDYVDANSDWIRRIGLRLVSLDELLREADYVTCHVPLTEETREMFNAERFRIMKPTSIFINTSRGQVVDEAALIDALQTNRIRGAALDVRSTEPPNRSPLDQLDNVVLTPHIAAFTEEAQDRVVASVCHDVAAVLRGHDARNSFNFARPKRAAATNDRNEGKTI